MLQDVHSARISIWSYNTTMNSIQFTAAKAKEVTTRMGLLSTEAKNQILEKIADGIEENSQAILKANAKDIAAGKRKGLSAGLLDRLLLTKDRLKGIVADVRNVASLKDYVGQVLESRELPNGLFLKKIRVPIGVIAMIYESRPNVTVDAAALCLKSGNAVILKGGSDAANSNRAFVKLIRDVLEKLQDAVQLADCADRKVTGELLGLHEFIDVVIPRGGKSLINFVRDNSRIPMIITGASVVHTYIHEDADLGKALQIVLNAKLRRVSICNTLDSLLLHKNIAQKFLKLFASALPENLYKADHLEIRADDASFDALRKFQKSKIFSLTLKKSSPQDYHTEFLDYILAVKVVRDLDEAINHISRHSLKHSEAIITENATVAARFLNEVDAACVYWNASTQFSDGAQFGLGAEIGISTQKLHVRGPFALEGLTSYKWVIEGNGQIRNP